VAERQVGYLVEQLGMNVSEVLETAVAGLYGKVRLEQNRAAKALIESGFVGCAEGPIDLSEKGKSNLTRSLKAKHAHRGYRVLSRARQSSRPLTSARGRGTASQSRDADQRLAGGAQDHTSAQCTARQRSIAPLRAQPRSLSNQVLAHLICAPDIHVRT
jgi:hypothetical protein